MRTNLELLISNDPVIYPDAPRRPLRIQKTSTLAISMYERSIQHPRLHTQNASKSYHITPYVFFPTFVKKALIFFIPLVSTFFNILTARPSLFFFFSSSSFLRFFSSRLAIASSSSS